MEELDTQDGAGQTGKVRPNDRAGGEVPWHNVA